MVCLHTAREAVGEVVGCGNAGCPEGDDRNIGPRWADAAKAGMGRSSVICGVVSINSMRHVRLVTF